MYFILKSYVMILDLNFFTVFSFEKSLQVLVIVLDYCDF